jgi:hypothetical protein
VISKGKSDWSSSNNAFSANGRKGVDGEYFCNVLKLLAVVKIKTAKASKPQQTTVAYRRSYGAARENRCNPAFLRLD